MPSSSPTDRAGLPNAGTRVDVHWDDRDQVFSGVVSKRTRFHVLVAYDDGDLHTHNLNDIRWRVASSGLWCDPGDATEMVLDAQDECYASGDKDNIHDDCRPKRKVTFTPTVTVTSKHKHKHMRKRKRSHYRNGKAVPRPPRKQQKTSLLPDTEHVRPETETETETETKTDTERMVHTHHHQMGGERGGVPHRQQTLKRKLTAIDLSAVCDRGEFNYNYNSDYDCDYDYDSECDGEANSHDLASPMSCVSDGDSENERPGTCAEKGARTRVEKTVAFLGEYIEADDEDGSEDGGCEGKGKKNVAKLDLDGMDEIDDVGGTIQVEMEGGVTLECMTPVGLGAKESRDNGVGRTDGNEGDCTGRGEREKDADLLLGLSSRCAKRADECGTETKMEVEMGKRMDYRRISLQDLLN